MEVLNTATHLTILPNNTGVRKENKDIKVASCNVPELFSGLIPQSSIHGNLIIPEYQRPYVWGKKEIHQLLKDLKEYFSNVKDEKPMYYLGSVILHQHENSLKIIDGQQRLTTLAILQSFLNTSEVPEIKFNSPVSTQNIRHNFQLIKKIAEEYEEFSGFDLGQINITLIVTESEDDAYTFFETQNTGGVRLTGVDIIKAHHLRALDSERYRGHYAKIWENQKEVNTVVNHLLKARSWGFLHWQDLPSHRDKRTTKNKIIREFSQKTLSNKHNFAYQFVAFDNSKNSSRLQLPPYRFSIRQPLANGENFIEYLESFCEIYSRLFINRSDKEIDDEFYKFNRNVIQKVDGTAYLKDLFEVAMLCYTHRFGVEHLLEAAYWIFRFTYSLRVSNEKTVREDSIPAFIRKDKEHYLFDHILTSYTHEELFGKLNSFKVDINSANCENNNVKGRFIERVELFFEFNSREKDKEGKTIINNYDKLFKKAINDRICNKK